MQNQLAEFKLGRIVLHLLCSCQDKNFPWHWRGIVREISQGALLVSPTSKCDATERCFENETETDSRPDAWKGTNGPNRRVARVTFALCACTVAAPSIGYAQLDPERRDLLQLGFNQSLHNDGPPAAYAFYYWNRPNVPTTNTTLRLAIAPVYVDGELGFKGLLGQNTDLGVGVFGGGFFNDYHEVRQGNYYRDESFAGKGGGAAVSIYHEFNPGASIPLNGIVRGGMNYHVFSDTSDTADDFRLPKRPAVLHAPHRSSLGWQGAPAHSTAGGGTFRLVRPRVPAEPRDLRLRPATGNSIPFLIDSLAARC